MAKNKTNSKATEKRIIPEKITTVLKSETVHFAIGLFCLIFGVYLLLAFSSFFFTGGNDQSILNHQEANELLQTDNRIQNYAGARGAQLAQFLINDCFGIPAFIILVFLIVTGMTLMKAYQFHLKKWFIGSTLTMIWASIALGFIFQGVFEDSFIYPGGLHGYNVSRWICSQIGAPGLILSLLVTAILVGVLLTRQTMQVVRKAFHPTLPKRNKEVNGAHEKNESTADSSLQSAEQPVSCDELEEEETDANLEEIEPEETDETEIPYCAEEEEESAAIELPLEAQEKAESAPSGKLLTAQKERTDAVQAVHNEPAFEIDHSHTDADEALEEEDLARPYNPRLDLEHYKYPTLDLLNTYNDSEPTIDMEEQNANKDRIIRVLRSFDIEISSIKASVGPTITLYEITPAEGVRISKIRNLEDDIALSLSALGIRIIAPIPGKGTIGIEVPNANPRIVPMSSILASKKFQETTFELPVALGRTITNEVFMVDLAKAPHMLVAGATGQGKSVGLNAIVTSLLYKKHPSELKFVIIDPKKVEFAIYAPIERHFLAKLPDGEDAIITDVTKVVQTLNSLCIEMDTRYDLLKKAGCRNIKEYNAKFINRQLNPEKGHRFMPYIVIIIDEFGDLIMTAGKEVELPICRIAQLARAVGIHAIIATQRPTTNIITGTIKANFPARVAFRVASMMDSRTILDRPGAQQLIGKGDMLYLQGNDPVRVQCAFVDTPEVEKIANYISRQQGYPTAFMLPEYVDENAEPSGSADVDMNRLDPLFEEAARLLIYHQQGSTSLIQRKFSIGYNRAGRIMDQLERAGIVGAANGSKAREVLCMDENDLEMRMSNLRN